ncbi:uncharacterized protein LOC112468443 [Temnothorax curvispinosus]|uniref:ribonuclease H n=1 Tax=Temnothorax curvispinosus TaxID=300111 RepID=A0A6J1REL3_9HYME|nr:uncharacterized protein LOC112468443 [Temnothorax curvispinosus]
MFAEAKEPPLKLRLKFLAAKYLIKTMSITDHQVSESMFQLALTSREYPAGLTHCREKFSLFDLFRQLKSLRPSLHTAVAPPPFQHSYQTILFTPILYHPEQDFIDLIDQVPKSTVQNLFLQAFGPIMRDSIVFYTDGSKMGSANWVGAACFSPQLQRSLMFKLPARASIFTVEAWAIYNAVLLILDLDTPKFTIVSDSKSVLEALTNPVTCRSNYLIPLIKSKIIYAQERGKNIQLVWIPSHKGIMGNEIADEFARKAIRSGMESPAFKLPHSDLFIEQREKLATEFHNYLFSRARYKGNHFFQNIYVNSSKL